MKTRPTLFENAANVLRMTVVMLMLTTIASCSESTEDRLIGTWQDIQDEQGIMEFKTDGTLAPKTADGQALSEVHGTWKILEDGLLKMDVSVSGKTRSETTKIEFSGNDLLTLTPQAGRAGKFRRMKQ